MEIDQFINSFDKEYSEEPEPKSDSGSILGRLCKNFSRGGSSPREDITQKKCALIRAFAFDTSTGSPKLSEGFFLKGARAVNPSLIKSLLKEEGTHNFTDDEKAIINEQFQEISDKVSEYKQLKEALHSDGDLGSLLANSEFTEALLSENDHGICPLEKFLANESPGCVQKLLFAILDNSDPIPGADRLTKVVMKSIQNQSFLSQRKIFKGLSRGFSEHFDYSKKGQEVVLKEILAGSGSSKRRSVLAYRAIQCMDKGEYQNVPISLLTLAIGSVKPESQVAKIMSLASASEDGDDDISKAFVMSQCLSAKDLKTVLVAVKDEKVRAKIISSEMLSYAVVDHPDKLDAILSSLPNGKLKDAVILKNKGYILDAYVNGKEPDSSLTILKHIDSPKTKIKVMQMKSSASTEVADFHGTFINLIVEKCDVASLDVLLEGVPEKEINKVLDHQEKHGPEWHEYSSPLKSLDYLPSDKAINVYKTILKYTPKESISRKLDDIARGGG